MSHIFIYGLTIPCLVLVNTIFRGQQTITIKDALERLSGEGELECSLLCEPIKADETIYIDANDVSLFTYSDQNKNQKDDEWLKERIAWLKKRILSHQSLQAMGEAWDETRKLGIQNPWNRCPITTLHTFDPESKAFKGTVDAGSFLPNRPLYDRVVEFDRPLYDRVVEFERKLANIHEREQRKFANLFSATPQINTCTP